MGLALKMYKADVPDKLNQGFLLDHELKTGTHSLIIAKALKIFFFLVGENMHHLFPAFGIPTSTLEEHRRRTV